MFLKSINLQNFRSYKKKIFKFSEGTTLVTGPNTSGKTNLLEAIYLLATGKSFRAGLEKEMIGYGQDMARVKGKVETQEGEEILEIVLTVGQVAGEKTAKKKYLLNGVSKRRNDFLGHLRSVLFRPEDLEIIINSPSTRRDYLDSVLEQVDNDYRRAALSYQKGLRQRNKLLEQIREEGKPRSILFFWDKLLIENGEIITQKRQELIDFINQQPDYFGNLEIKYDASLISPQRLAKYSQEEVAAGMTLVGPHRDDFQFLSKAKSGSRDLHAFGSRGEQRLAIFSLKLAELEFISQKTDRPSTNSGQVRPVLLLDDILSELDKEHRAKIFDVIPQQQTIITTTDLNLVKPLDLKKLEIITLAH